jgi:hypothetical protein
MDSRARNGKRREKYIIVAGLPKPALAPQAPRRLIPKSAVRKSRSFRHDCGGYAVNGRQLVNEEQTRTQSVEESGRNSTVVAVDFGLPRSAHR